MANVLLLQCYYKDTVGHLQIGHLFVHKPYRLSCYLYDIIRLAVREFIIQSCGVQLLITSNTINSGSIFLANEHLYFLLAAVDGHTFWYLRYYANVVKSEYNSNFTILRFSTIIRHHITLCRPRIEWATRGFLAATVRIESLVFPVEVYFTRDVARRLIFYNTRT